ncbi:hypothetical protein DL93DRAFT_594389 [Clavulina sp. PMI_390]|nr:hypothetical protein DL93DRAFT_594389 [Clavulina sp. PMI_390]
MASRLPKRKQPTSSKQVSKAPSPAAEEPLPPIKVYKPPRLSSPFKPLPTFQPSQSSTPTSSGTKRPHPSSSRRPLSTEAPDENLTLPPRKIQKTSAESTRSRAATAHAASGSGAGNTLYPGGRRLPTPMRGDRASSRVGSNSSAHTPSRSREPSVKTEDEEDSPLDSPIHNIPTFQDVRGALNGGDDMEEDDVEFEPWIDEYIIETQGGSPPPQHWEERRHTKLGQRKPTPRRLLLPNEGDLSAMAKTVYYEHDGDEVEARSPSPNSRRRAIRAREKALDVVPLKSSSQSKRILDALDADEDTDEDDDEREPIPDPSHAAEDPQEPTDGVETGYVHDPRGFQVLEEVTPENSETSMSISAASEPEVLTTSHARSAHHAKPSSAPKPKPTSRHHPVSQPPQSRVRDIPPSQPSQDWLVSDTEEEVDTPLPVEHPVTEQLDGPTLVIVAPTPTPQSPPIREIRPAVSQPSIEEESVEYDEPDAEEPSLHRSYDYEDQLDDEDEDEDDSIDPDVVTIQSSDPKKAAKVAAILRSRHGYVIEDPANQTTRSTHDSSARPRSRSRSRFRSEHTADVSMPDLVDEVEVELSQNPTRPVARASSPTKPPSTSRIPRPIVPARRVSGGSKRRHSPAGSAVSGDTSIASESSSSGPDPWTKEDWRNLERCFVAERKVVAQRLQLPSSRDVDPGHIDVELVAERFKGFLIASKQIKVGPEWDRGKLVTRVKVLAKSIGKKTSEPRSSNGNSSRDAATPSTFGDEIDYDRSISVATSRHSSVVSTVAVAAGAGGGLYPQVHVRGRSVSGPKRTVSGSSESGREGSVPKPSVTSRLLNYLNVGRASATPPPASDDAFKRPLPRAPSVIRSPVDSTSPTPVPPSHEPEMAQVRRGSATPLVDPLRRSHTGPMKDPDVRLMREREAHPSLRHREPAPAILDSSPARPPSIPPLNHVDIDDIGYMRASYSPVDAPRRLRSVSSTGSVRDLVRGFEHLNQEVEEQIRASTPGSRPGTASPGPYTSRPRWSGESSTSYPDPRNLSGSVSDESASFDVSASGGEQSYLFSDTSFSSAAHVREIVVPKRKAIPDNAAPHKKRMSFLNGWAPS